jgi:hypothetical protein
MAGHCRSKNGVASLAYSRPSRSGRAPCLADQGFRAMTFWNNEVLNDTDAVIGRILEAAGDPAYPFPACRRAARHPLPQGERGTTVRSAHAEAHDSEIP